jgi:hypothetical protein
VHVQHKRNIKARSRNRRCRGKAESITYSECMSVACYPARKVHVPYCHLWPVRFYNIFLHYLINGQIFGGEKILVIQYVFWFSLQLLSETFILRRIQRDVIIKVNKLSCKLSTIIVRFKSNLSFLDKFSKNTKIWNFIKIRPVGNELFREDEQTGRQTDRYDEADSGFSLFCKRAKKSYLFLLQIFG